MRNIELNIVPDLKIDSYKPPSVTETNDTKLSKISVDQDDKPSISNNNSKGCIEPLLNATKLHEVADYNGKGNPIN